MNSIIGVLVYLIMLTNWSWRTHNYNHHFFQMPPTYITYHHLPYKITCMCGASVGTLGFMSSHIYHSYSCMHTLVFNVCLSVSLYICSYSSPPLQPPPPPPPPPPLLIPWVIFSMWHDWPQCCQVYVVFAGGLRPNPPTEVKHVYCRSRHWHRVILLKDMIEITSPQRTLLQVLNIRFPISLMYLYPLKRGQPP